MVPAAARPSMDSRRTVNSVPRPSTPWTESPGRRRKTRERCRVSCSSKTTRSAVIASGLTWKRATRLSREAEGGPAVHVGAPGGGVAARIGLVAHDASEDQVAAGAQEPPVLRRVGDVAPREKVGEDQGKRGPLHAARIDQRAPDALADPVPEGVGLSGGP